MTQELPPPIQLMQILFGFAASRAIGVSAELRIADLLKDGAKTAEELAEQTGVHARSLYRVLRACASIGVYSEDSEKKFSLTPLAEPLVSDAPGSLRNPLLYLRLERNADNLNVIHYGFEQINNDKELSNRTTLFTRSIYRLTSKEITQINIEDCVSNSWCITECSALYEYVEEGMKYHQFQQIKYRPAATRRKQMKAVA